MESHQENISFIPNQKAFLPNDENANEKNFQFSS